MKTKIEFNTKLLAKMMVIPFEVAMFGLAYGIHESNYEVSLISSFVMFISGIAMMPMLLGFSKASD